MSHTGTPPDYDTFMSLNRFVRAAYRRVLISRNFLSAASNRLDKPKSEFVAPQSSTVSPIWIDVGDKRYVVAWPLAWQKEQKKKKRKKKD